MTDTADIETRAKDMGWIPKEEFRGDTDRWIDAETYVRRGEEMLPILQANNRKLESTVNELRGQLGETTNLLRSAQESIDALKEFNNTQTRAAAKEKKKEIISAIAEARRDGDVETEVELQEQLEEQTAALKEAEKKPETKPAANGNGTGATKDPALVAWSAENPWFGTDTEKSEIALAIAKTLRGQPNPLQGKPFYDELTKKLDSYFGKGKTTSASRVEGSRNGSGDGGNSGGGKSYADLSPELKATCDRLATRVVGKGRAFKDIGEWRKHYAKTQFEE